MPTRVALLHFGALQMFVSQLLMEGITEEFVEDVERATREDAPKHSAAVEFATMVVTAFWQSPEIPRWLVSSKKIS